MSLENSALHEQASGHFSQNWANQVFNAVSPLSESEVLAIATKGLKSIKMRAINTSNRQSNQFQLSYEGVGFRDMYDIDMGRDTLGHGNLVSTLGDRKTGRRMFANRVLVGLALNIKSTTVDAGEFMGALVWPKAGLLPTNAAKLDLADSLSTRAEILERYLDDDTNADIRYLCELKEPEALRELANLAMPIPVSEADFNRAQRLTNGNYRYREFVDRGFIQEHRMTAAQFLLCGLSFVGSISFNDKEQMKLLEDYTRVPIRLTHAVMECERKKAAKIQGAKAYTVTS